MSRPEFGLDRGKVFPAANAKSLLNPARRLVLADLQAEMLSLARQRVGADAHSTFVQADGSALPIADGVLDAVFIATVLGEIPDKGACLTDVRRGLRWQYVARFQPQ